MIEKIRIEGFKSLEDVEVELGRLNVFVGANGSGKSNLLEAVGVLSAAADGKVNDQTLLQRGVRPGVPYMYTSAFPTSRMGSISFAASSAKAGYAVALGKPLRAGHAWRFETEELRDGSVMVAERGANSKPNPESGLAALRMIDLSPDSSAAQLMDLLQRFAIYTASAAVLRGVQPDPQPRSPLGINGGRLPEALLDLMAPSSGSHADSVRRQATQLIDWVDGLGLAKSEFLELSPAAGAGSHVVTFRDRFMRPDWNKVSGYDASEGALFVLMLAVLAGHPDSPRLFAIDNSDYGLNPGLAAQLTTAFSEWILSNPRQPQVLMTSHNPAVLDGLPLQDDRVRLFTVDRDDVGRTVVRRVEITPQLLRLSSERDWPLSRLWMNKLIGGMPSV